MADRTRKNNRSLCRRLWSVIALGVVALCGTAFANTQVPQTRLDPTTISQFVDPLPIPSRLDGTNPLGLTITMSEFPQKVLPSTFTAGPYQGKTLVWGYNGSSPGPTVVAQRGTQTMVHYINNLANGVNPPLLQQYLTVDMTLHWADSLGSNCMMNPGTPGAGNPCFQPYVGPAPAVVHLHGGEVHSSSDGFPQAWFTPGLGLTGPAFVSDIDTYPNLQEAATLWYHDHALGITRLNVYGGLAGFYLLRDPANEPANLPSGPYEIEMAIQDREFDTNGQLLFPDSPATNPTVHPFWIPEFFGDVILVNGKTWPYLNVEPRRYRFRLLNGSSARFYSLRLANQNPLGAAPPAIYQIGTDGGLLDTPVIPTDPANPLTAALVLAPGERADVIIDFSAMPPGTSLLLQNSANAPFPGGTAPNPLTSGRVMQFNVAVPLAGTDTSFDPSVPAANLRPNNPIQRLAPTITTATPKRTLTLNENTGAGGPLEVLLNNSKWMGGLTENPVVGSTEVWEVVNLTADSHPIHLHLIEFQILSRQSFDTVGYNAAYTAAFPGGAYTPAVGPPPSGNPDVTPFLLGTPVLPTGTNDNGWKDTIKMNFGEVTRIAVRLAPTDAPATGPGAPASGVNPFVFDPSTGPGYVWHCHILDHEDNEMMRPYRVRLAKNRILWQSAADGLVSLWRLVDADNYLSFHTYGPFAGWTSADYHQNSDGTGKLLWSRNVDGLASLWALDTSDNFVNFKMYGPYPGWRAVSYSAGINSTPRLLWMRDADGFASLWGLDANDNYANFRTYGPYAGWTAVSYHKNPDGTARLLWVRTSDGFASLWKLDQNDAFVSYTAYGPYPGWVPTSYSKADDGKGRLLWSNTVDGSTSLWTLDASDNYLGYKLYGPFPGWSAQSYD